MVWLPLQHMPRDSVVPDVWPLWRESKWSTAFIRDTQCTLNMEANDEWRETPLCFPLPLSQPPSQYMCIPQPHASVLQTAVKQSRLECVTACNAAPGHATCLLPLRTEGKEIINRFQLRAEQRGSWSQIMSHRERRNVLSEYFGWSYYFTFALKPLNTT